MLVDRYLTRRFVHVFAMAMAAFIALYLLIDFFEKVDELLAHQASLAVGLSYFALKVPLIAVQVFPVAVLLGVYMTLGGLVRTSELTALWAGGIGLGRIVAPLAGSALLITLGMILIGEALVPMTVRAMNQLWATQVLKREAISYRLDRLWLRDGDSIINVRLAEPEEGRLSGLSIFRFDEDFHLRERLDARVAEYSEASGWQGEEVRVYRFAEDSARLQESHALEQSSLPQLSRTPEAFRLARPSAEEMNFAQLRHQALRLEVDGYDATRPRVDMHNRLAAPMAGLVTALLGIPFALRKGRGGSLVLGVAVTVAIGFSYFVVHAIGLALGYSGVLPPLLAAWSGNLMFLTLAAWLLSVRASS